jgi:ribonuclease P protein component
MRQANRLHSRAEFKAIMTGGHRAQNRLAVVYAVTAPAPHWKAGFVVSKAVGKSVQRHKVTRRLRAIVDRRLGQANPAHQVVVRVRPGAASASVSDLDQAVGEALERAAR